MGRLIKELLTHIVLKKPKLFYMSVLIAFAMLSTLFAFFVSNYMKDDFIKKQYSRIVDEKFLLFSQNLEYFIKDHIHLMENIHYSASYTLEKRELQAKDFHKIFEDISKTHESIFQLRYLDKKGDEIIRIDRNKTSAQPHFIEKLQNKAHRAYFQKIKNCEGICISELNLNQENGKVQKPIVPTIRLGISLKDKEGNFQGMIVMNLFLSTFLDTLDLSAIFSHVLLDKQKNILHVSDQNLVQEFAWSKDLHKSKTIVQLLERYGIKTDDKNFEKLLKGKGSNLEFAYTKSLEDSIHNNQGLMLLFFIKSSFTSIVYSEGVKLIALIGVIVFFLSLAISYLLSMFIVTLDKESKENLLKYNEQLKSDIDTKLQEIKKQELVLIQQNKLASMGEMIQNIAHQWRQPLNSIGIISSKIRFSIDTKRVDKNFLHTELSNIERTTKYLSKTIDEFRNFFHVKETEHNFSVKQSLLVAISLIKTRLDYNGIDFKTKFYDDFEVEGVKGELIQVYLNIINNAIDALEGVDEPKLTIFVENLGDIGVIRFQDNAGGVDENNFQKIFEPYFTTKGKLQGTGIGLYMSRQIITTKFDGRIVVENRKRGACFSIYLPTTISQ